MEKNNKIIAEFMGGKVEIYTDWNSGEKWEICTLPQKSNPLYIRNPNYYGIAVFKTQDIKTNKCTVHERSLQYHNSWEWLMTVVDKIFSLGYDYAIKPRYVMIKERMGQASVVYVGQGETQQEVVYQAVVEFIINLKNK